MKAWHVTEAHRAGELLAQGMRPFSYWATDEALVDYYAEDYENPVVLEIETDALDPAALAFAPDWPSIEEPISGAIGKSEDEVAEAWEAVPGKGTWLDSIEVVGSFRIEAALAGAMICLRDAPGLAP